MEESYNHNLNQRLIMNNLFHKNGYLSVYHHQHRNMHTSDLFLRYLIVFDYHQYNNQDNLLEEGVMAQDINHLYNDNTRQLTHQMMRGMMTMMMIHPHLLHVIPSNYHHQNQNNQ